MAGEAGAAGVHATGDTVVQGRWRRGGGAALLMVALSSSGSFAGAQPTSLPEPSTTSSPAVSTTAPPSTTSSSTTPGSTTTVPASSTTTATTIATSTSREPVVTDTTVRVGTTARPAATPATSGPTSSARPATTTTRSRPTTTVAEGPQSSVIIPAGSDRSGDDESRTVVTIVVALLAVVGLLVATLTWRYWWFTDPRRGYVRSRAVLARGATLDDAEGELVRVVHPGDPSGAPDASGGSEVVGGRRGRVR